MSAMSAYGSRKLIRVVWPFVTIVGALLLVSVFSLNVLSTIRAYVGGEGCGPRRRKMPSTISRAMLAVVPRRISMPTRQPLPSSWVIVRHGWRWIVHHPIWTWHAPGCCRGQSSG
jgi:hypothetical protein